MRKRIAVYSLGALCLLFSSCAQEFNQVYKSQDYNYKYEYAKECFARGKYSRATTLLQDLIIQMKGHKAEQESLYMLAMSEYCDMDYTTASEAFKKYVKSYPRVLMQSRLPTTSVRACICRLLSHVSTKVRP